MILQWALNKFTNSYDRQQYDTYGDEDSKISPSTITYFYPEFYKTHRLYVVAGAFRRDGPEEILLALEKSVLGVLRNNSMSPAARSFRNDWYNASYILSSKKRRANYDNGDRFGDAGISTVESYSQRTGL